MKNLITIFLFLGLSLLLSCNKKDLLELAPQTNQSSATFFQSEQHFNQALTGIYAMLRSLPTYGVFMDEMRSDNTFFTFFPGDRSRALHEEAIAQFVDDDRASHTINRYSNNYIGISRANTLLSRITHFDDIKEVTKKGIIAEALFLRSFFYFDLVTHYGGVPLQLEDVTSVDGVFLPRATADEVYSQIVKDLAASISDLPVADKFPQSGRVTKGAAKMLLAYVYMSKPVRDYEKAGQELMDIVNMNYSLMDNYADCFDPAKKNNSESIFEIQFKDGNDGLHSDFIWKFIPKTVDAELITGIDVAIQNINWGGWNVPTKDLIDSYEIGDERLNISVAVAEGIQQNNGTFLIEQVKNAEGYIPSTGKVYYYFINKYCHPSYTVEFKSGENWPVFRYADALLLLAECMMEQGKENDALTYTNKVRERAGLTDLSSISKELILKERRHELAFENHRWLDLIRTDKAIDVLREHGDLMKQQYGWILPNAFNITQDRLIYPIPFREIQINNNLIQNPGY